MLSPFSTDRQTERAGEEFFTLREKRKEGKGKSLGRRITVDQRVLNVK